MNLLSQLFFGLFAILGFSIVINVPKNKLKYACVLGAISWGMFYYLKGGDGSNILAAGFWASVLIGCISDVLSRITKEASTIYVIPGILPLVPGAGMYRTMWFFINGSLDEAAQTGTETLMLAGSISLGIMTVGALSKLFSLIKSRKQNKIQMKKNEFELKMVHKSNKMNQK